MWQDTLMTWRFQFLLVSSLWFYFDLIFYGFMFPMLLKNFYGLEWPGWGMITYFSACGLSFNNTMVYLRIWWHCESRVNTGIPCLWLSDIHTNDTMSIYVEPISERSQHICHNKFNDDKCTRSSFHLHIFYLPSPNPFIILCSM